MGLGLGTRLGPYQIVAPLGAGGMGEVYRSTDTKLDRDVAIKVLPAAFTADAERLARFEREAKLLASLNHSNIAHVYGFESATLDDASSVHFLAMELVEGEDLSERLKRGAIPVDESIAIAKQIAEGLEEAHEHGIIHRDLKPANIKLTPDGKVKVLDFGLAKAFDTDPGVNSGSNQLSHSPTMSRHATEAGMILGTAAYMSPEQARGKPLDKRTDIWAFGVVLFEMLTGERLFRGETVSDVLAAVLTHEPDWKTLPSATPPGVERALRRCLERDPRQRVRDAGDIRIELQGARSGASTDRVQPATVRTRRVLVGGMGTALLLGGLAVGFAVGHRSPEADRGVVRFEIAAPKGLAITNGVTGSIAISPDDRAIVLVAGDTSGSRLYLRRFDQADPLPVPGTGDANDPFFSPDGRWVGFFAAGRLRKVSLADGTQAELTAANDSTGAAWAPDGTIVFAPGYSSGLVRVSSAGGDTRPVTSRDAKTGEASHSWPDVLPDGDHVLYTIEYTGKPFDEAALAVVSLRTGVSKIVLRGGASGRYSPSGHLVYARGSRLFAVPFDLQRLETSGEATTLVDGVAAEVGRGRSHFAISRAGTLAFVPGELDDKARELLWASRDGTLTPATARRRGFSDVSLSPDGQRALFPISGSDDDVWMLDLSRDIPTRITFGTENGIPAWAGDGRRFAWASDRSGQFNLYLSSLDDPSKVERLTTSDHRQTAGSFSSDGARLVYAEEDPTTLGDIWVLPLEGDRKPQPAVRTRFDERRPALSPDGHWLAYLSDETGRPELFVQAFPGPGPKQQVSDNRGADTRLQGSGSREFRPLRWSRDGRELFYWNEDRLMSVPFKAGRDLDAGPPRAVFEQADIISFDVAPDGRRFLLIRQPAPTPLTRLVVALGGARQIGSKTP
jgi:serine/threonine protein kinase/Tol biopolymer transport system component